MVLGRRGFEMQLVYIILGLLLLIWLLFYVADLREGTLGLIGRLFS